MIDNNDKYVCSNCGAVVSSTDKYCRNCLELLDDVNESEKDDEEIVEEEKHKDKPNKPLNKNENDSFEKKEKDLRKIKKLLDDKIITKEEFEKEKKKILK